MSARISKKQQNGHFSRLEDRQSKDLLLLETQKCQNCQFHRHVGGILQSEEGQPYRYKESWG
jgi:hypothetical protein